MTESQFPNTNDWKRKAISVGEIPIVLHDHRVPTDGARGAVTIENGSVLRANVADVDFRSCFSLAMTTPSASPERAVVHINTTPIEFLRSACPNPSDQYQAIILQVTTQISGLNEEHDLHNGVVWFLMKDRAAFERVSDWLPEFLKLDFGQASKLAKFKARTAASAWESANPGFDHFLDIILPGRVENFLAFRLLCEARQFCGKADEQVCGDTSLIIHAPKDLCDWLAPFGENLSERDIPRLARLIAGGEQKEQVEAILSHARDNDEGIMKAISAFLSAANKAS